MVEGNCSWQLPASQKPMPSRGKSSMLFHLHFHEDKAGKEFLEEVGGFLRHALSQRGDALHLEAPFAFPDIINVGPLARNIENPNGTAPC
jgi:hypothetical protein